MSNEVRPKYAGQEYPEIYSFLAQRKEENAAWFNWFTSQLYDQGADQQETGCKELLALVEHDIPLHNAVAEKLESVVEGVETTRSELCDMSFIEGFSAGVKLLLEALTVGNTTNPNRRNSL